jgi:hypothetical protein
MAEEVAAAAQAAYEAYSLAVGGRDRYQHPLEPYSDLHDVYKAAWEQAAMAAVGTAAVPPPKEAAPTAAAEPATKADVEDEDAEPRSRGGRRS